MASYVITLTAYFGYRHNGPKAPLDPARQFNRSDRRCFRVQINDLKARIRCYHPTSG